MNLPDNIKTIRETKNLKQIEVANHIGVDKSAYNKIEKSMRAIAIEELHKVVGLFNMSTDQIINYEGIIPKEIVIENKTAVEQMRLIQELDDDKQTIFRLIDKMLTNKKFQTFFEQNLQLIK